MSNIEAYVNVAVGEIASVRILESYAKSTPARGEKMLFGMYNGLITDAIKPYIAHMVQEANKSGMPPPVDISQLLLTTSIVYRYFKFRGDWAKMRADTVNEYLPHIQMSEERLNQLVEEAMPIIRIVLDQMLGPSEKESKNGR